MNGVPDLVMISTHGWQKSYNFSSATAIYIKGRLHKLDFNEQE